MRDGAGEECCFGLPEKAFNPMSLLSNMIFVLRPSDVVDISQPHSLLYSPAFAIKSVKKMNVPYKFIVPGLDVYKSM